MAKIKISSLSQYCDMVQHCIDETLREEVFQFAQSVISKAIDDKVYSNYTPTYYERRGENGGLSDDRNIVYDHTTGKIDIMVIAEPNRSVFNTPIRGGNDTLLASWIEFGKVKNVFNNEDYEWMHPRPFMKTAMDILRSNSRIESMLKKGMRKRGLRFSK